MQSAHTKLSDADAAHARVRTCATALQKARAQFKAQQARASKRQLQLEALKAGSARQQHLLKVRPYERD